MNTHQDVRKFNRAISAYKYKIIETVYEEHNLESGFMTYIGSWEYAADHPDISGWSVSEYVGGEWYPYEPFNGSFKYCRS